MSTTAHKAEGSGRPVQPEMAELFTTPDRDAFYAELAAAGPVVRGRHFDGSPVWLVTGHDECLAVLKDHHRFSNDFVRFRSSVDVAAAAGLPPDVEPYLVSTLGAYDPPAHTRLRKLASRAFTAKRIQAFRPRIQRIVDDLLAGWEHETEVDAVTTLAYPLPIRVICELLGVPEEDLDRWWVWARDIVAHDQTVVVESARGLIGYMSELVEAKRAEPADDLLSTLALAQEEDGDRLSDQELISLSLTILLAGHATTVELLGNGLVLMLTHPEQRARLAADPDLVPAAVEEMLRWAGPAEIAPMRYAIESVELGGQRLEAGDAVQLVYAAANRDPRRFEHAEVVELGRTDNEHLGFGQGIHFCLGAMLARAEADIAFRTVLRRFGDLELAVPADQLARTPGLSASLSSLPVRPRGAAGTTGSGSSDD